jgi:eukaryotic-like serine/threonine-protein kinase
MAQSTRQKAPRLIGNCEVLERLATTELATVYKGRDPETGELVAIKIATPAICGNPVLVKRFSQEFTMIKELKHPHLIRALRFGYHDDAPFMVLEYVDGMSLGDRIEQDKRLAEPEAVRIITQVGEALHYAHQQRVIHRDVKPDNILLTADGVAKLADLGLAKDCESDELLTRPSSGLGTPNFMAPEQFTDAKNADRRCDVYSLGATLYMAVTGVIPFRARGYLSVLKKKLDKEITPPRELAPELSARVEAAILRAVDINPRARQASCLQFIEDLTPRTAGKRSTVVPVPGRTKHKSANDYERRATVRFPSKQGAAVHPLSGGKEEWEATIRDISADGVGLVLPRRFEPRTVLSLDLAATDTEPARRLFVRIVRVTTLPSRRWLVGCIFANRLGEDEVQSLV